MDHADIDSPMIYKNNEAEALRSWRSALDQIYYHNAYRVPPNYRPKSETEKALQDSLRDMELQCKERVDLLEALRQSRTKSKEAGDKSTNEISTRGHLSITRPSKALDSEHHERDKLEWMGQGTIPAVNYPDLSRPGPPLPRRPAVSQQKSSEIRLQALGSAPHNPHEALPTLYSPPVLPTLAKKSSRTPSPEKRNRMLTTLRPNKDGKRPSNSPRSSMGRRSGPPTASKAAGLAWDSVSRSSGAKLGQSLASQAGSTSTLTSIYHDGSGENDSVRRNSSFAVEGGESNLQNANHPKPVAPTDLLSSPDNSTVDKKSQNVEDLISLEPLTPPILQTEMKDVGINPVTNKTAIRPQKPSADYISYRNEYPAASPNLKTAAMLHINKTTESSNASTFTRQRSPQRKPLPPGPLPVSRRASANSSSPRSSRREKDTQKQKSYSGSTDEATNSSYENTRKTTRKKRVEQKATDNPDTPSSTDRDSPEGSPTSKDWNERLAYIKKHLPKGVDENAAKQIFNEIVVQGDEVHWDDIAGLDVAKKALKEAVVYPFLRPDLFMGLREPARGMLLFGPPGTGKTMLARAVATESRSTFFAISASSLTSKWLGESEKLVRALFALAKALAPSIIFVDEIDSLLSSRGGSSEHESTRRIKTEFLIQWSDLQRAAAGKEQTDKEKKMGDASRVLVLAATNTPWAIDEAARRRFVRRQYIPLPEDHVRGKQLLTLMGYQKHELNAEDLEVLVQLTEGKSHPPALPGRS